MPSARVSLQPAYILHQKPYRDSSALLEVITPEYGRVGLVAKGAKRPSSKLRAVLQLFSPLLISWAGRGELATLTAAEMQGQALLKSEILACGLYINELIVRLTHRMEPQIELFSLYDHTLRQLSAPHVQASALFLQEILRYFELQLLYCLGYGLVLEKEASSNRAIRVDANYDYQLENGPVLINGPQEVYGLTIRGETLLALAEKRLGDNGNPVVFKEAKLLLRYVLERYLGNKPLMSRQLFGKKPVMVNNKT